MDEPAHAWPDHRRAAAILQPNCSVEDAIERLVFLARIEEGLAQLDRGERIPHDEVKRRLEL